MTLLFLVLATCFLAYSNGANDNFKGVASLFGSKTTSYRTAIWWATTTTFSGSIASIVLAQSLLMKFSGKGIVSDQIAGSDSFLLAIALGAGLTVIAATFKGFPVSTTHALTGGIVGAGLVAVGREINFQVLGAGFLLPLALSPVLALGLAAGFYLALRFLRLQLGITKQWCICVGETSQIIPIPQPASVMTLQVAGPLMVTVSTGDLGNCAEQYAGDFFGIRSQTIMDVAHFLSAGIISFARGLNDTPKIAAMLLVLQAFNIRWGIVAIAVSIAVGGLLSAARVAETMSHKITAMNHGQGFAANISTAFLVILATTFGLPVSTTHVSVGSLFGAGWIAGRSNTGVLAGIVLSWLLTLPCAALISGVIYWLIGRGAAV